MYTETRVGFQRILSPFFWMNEGIYLGFMNQTIKIVKLRIKDSLRKSNDLFPTGSTNILSFSLHVFWCSYCLFWDAVISEVIYARDKWLRRGGKIFPNRATLHIAALKKEEYGRQLDWWDHGKSKVWSDCTNR